MPYPGAQVAGCAKVALEGTPVIAFPPAMLKTSGSKFKLHAAGKRTLFVELREEAQQEQEPGMLGYYTLSDIPALVSWLDSGSANDFDLAEDIFQAFQPYMQHKLKQNEVRASAKRAMGNYASFNAEPVSFESSIFANADLGSHIAMPLLCPATKGTWLNASSAEICVLILMSLLPDWMYVTHKLHHYSPHGDPCTRDIARHSCDSQHFKLQATSDESSSDIHGDEDGFASVQPEPDFTSLLRSEILSWFEAVRFWEKRINWLQVCYEHNVHT